MIGKFTVRAVYGTMIAVASLALLGLFGLTQASPAFLPPLKAIGGVNASLGEFPSTVSIQNYRAHICAGNLISEEWVVTSAVCFGIFEDPEITVRYGDLTFGTGEEYEDPSKSIKVSKTIIHPNYTRTGGSDWILIKDDIALLKLDSKIDFSANPNVKASKLPKQSQAAPENVTSTLVGWGVTDSEKSLYPSSLQKLDVTLFDFSYCYQAVGGLNFSETQNLCAGDAANSKGACMGDGGSPLFVDDYQWGLVSWFRNPCASAPTVFTNLAHFADWIQSETGLAW